MVCSGGMPTRTHRTSFALDDATARRLKRLAARWNVSQAEGKMFNRDERAYPQRSVTDVPQWQMPLPPTVRRMRLAFHPSSPTLNCTRCARILK